MYCDVGNETKLQQSFFSALKKIIGQPLRCHGVIRIPGQDYYSYSQVKSCLRQAGAAVLRPVLELSHPGHEGFNLPNPNRFLNRL